MYASTSSISSGVAVGEPQVVERLVIHGEEAHGGAVLGRHVGDGGAIGQAERAQAGAVEFDELADHALLAQHLRDGQDQVGRGAAFRQPAVQLEADHRRQQHGDRLAQHAGLGLDPADAPADHAQAVDHGGVRIGADQRIGIGHAPSASRKTTDARYSRFTWWTMPVSGGTTRKLRKAVWPQRSSM